MAASGTTYLLLLLAQTVQNLRLNCPSSPGFWPLGCGAAIGSGSRSAVPSIPIVVESGSASGGGGGGGGGIGLRRGSILGRCGMWIVAKRVTGGRSGRRKRKATCKVRRYYWRRDRRPAQDLTMKTSVLIFCSTEVYLTSYASSSHKLQCCSASWRAANSVHGAELNVHHCLHVPRRGNTLARMMARHYLLLLRRLDISLKA